MIVVNESLHVYKFKILLDSNILVYLILQRVARFYANPEVLAPTKVNAELTSENIKATFKNGMIKGLVETLNSNLNRLSSLNPTASKG